MSAPKYPKMTRGHFEFIATVLREVITKESTRIKVAEGFARHLPKTNPNFSRKKFFDLVRDEEG